MCKVNVTEFRKNIFHYLEACSTEDIHITKNGDVVAVLSNPDKSYYKALYRLWFYTLLLPVRQHP